MLTYCVAGQLCISCELPTFGPADRMPALYV